MPVAVPLEFIPPIEPNFVELHILEGSDPTQPFDEIEVVTDIGIYPDYIKQWTTRNATASDDWFSIFWVDSKGAQTAPSSPIKAGTRTLLAEILDRVILRDNTLHETIVVEEAAQILFRLKGGDPFAFNYNDLNYTELKAVTDLTLAAAKYQTLLNLVGQSASYTAGMVSESTSTINSQQILDLIEKLEKRAYALLGIGGSLVASMKELVRSPLIEISGQKTTFDSSRLLAVKAIITEDLEQIDVS